MKVFFYSVFNVMVYKIIDIRVFLFFMMIIDGVKFEDVFKCDG